MQASLFYDKPTCTDAAMTVCERLPIEHGELLLFRNVFGADSQTLFQHLLQNLAWQQDEIQMHGKRYPVPRLQAWYGDPDAHYGYSGLSLTPTPWTDDLQLIRQRLKELCDQSFNSVLCNLYRDGRDSVSWHADDEPELGRNPRIASVSLGAVRRFQLKPKRGRGETLALELPHDSVLLMAGELQHHWIHQVPKTTRTVGPRINLTFRQIQTIGE